MLHSRYNYRDNYALCKAILQMAFGNTTTRKSLHENSLKVLLRKRSSKVTLYMSSIIFKLFLWLSTYILCLTKKKKMNQTRFGLRVDRASQNRTRHTQKQLIVKSFLYLTWQSLIPMENYQELIFYVLKTSLISLLWCLRRTISSI